MEVDNTNIKSTIVMILFHLIYYYFLIGINALQSLLYLPRDNNKIVCLLLFCKSVNINKYYYVLPCCYIQTI